MPKNPFSDRQLEPLLDRCEPILETLRERWPQGVITIVDPNQLGLWAIPATPLEDPAVSHDQLYAQLKHQSRWAAMAPSSETLDTMLLSQDFNCQRSYVVRGCTGVACWLICDPHEN